MFERFCGCAAAFVLATTLAGAAELPDGFRLEPVVSGLTDPAALAISPSGTILVAERTTGNLRVIRGGKLQAAPACSLAVETTGEAGLLGVAVHPSFDTSGWVYLYYTALGSGKNKVQRYTLGLTGCTAGPNILADLGAGPAFLRNGGGIAFGGDGKLYVATGDMEVPGNGQLDASLQGKVLRVNDDGTIPSDNPTPGSFVYAKGIRDGRSLSLRPSGQVYTVDGGNVSDSSVDELNVVPVAGNLGWDNFSGDSGGINDDPLTEWAPDGMRGLAVYTTGAFPDFAADGLDNDRDRFGANLFPGRARVDDNFAGVCIGSVNAELPCTSNADCPDRSGENAYCYHQDDLAEYCPGGTPLNDDDCSGTDEPDESYMGSVFLLAESSDTVIRAILDPSDPTVLDKTETFFDGSALADCPTSWTATAAGADGLLYLTAANGGGAAGALYRVVYDAAPGPREVSPSGSPFPLSIAKTGNDLVVTWEDLRDDALQPRDNGVSPLAPESEYTVWVGDIGNFTSHVPLVGFDAIQGNAVNDALREVTFAPANGSLYYLVSGRGDNYEGTLGADSAEVERAGYATTDLCPGNGFFASGTGWQQFTCGRSFTLLDELGEAHSLDEYRGKAVGMDFSAVWCGPCISQANVLEAMHQDYKDRGVQFLTLLIDEDINGIDWVGRPSWSECRVWGDRPPLIDDHTFTCLADPESATGQQQGWDRYNAFGAIPTNVLLDNGGRVVFAQAGFSQSSIADALDAMVGTTDSCLH